MVGTTDGDLIKILSEKNLVEHTPNQEKSIIDKPRIYKGRKKNALISLSLES